MPIKDRFLVPIFRHLEWLLNIARGRNRFGYSLLNVLRAFPSFDPNSGFVYRRQARFAIEAINNIFSSLLFLSEKNTEGYPPIPEYTTAEMRKSDLESRLKTAFDSHGSDKANYHDYHRVYAHLLDILGGAPSGVFEIGLGSSDTKVASNMGRSGIPGASVRAFASITQGPVFGADIDQKALVNDGRITSFQLDQLNPKQLSEFVSQNHLGVDLFIDDGLHSVTANLNSLTFGLQVSSSRGILVIEDIGEASLDLWRFIGNYLRPNFRDACLIRDRTGSYMFVLSKHEPLRLLD
jgi:hypothetical protein